MSHELTEDDQMFYTGEKPWHGLGVELPNLATAAEAIEAANLNWNVEVRPVFMRTVDDFGFPEYVEVPESAGTIRTDINKPLSSRVSLKYKPIQNVEAFSFMDNVTQDPNGPKYVTAGSLRGGARVWALAKLPDFIEITNEDIVEEYLLMSTSHDGTRMFNVMWTPVRVVCNNTLSVALHNANKENTVRIRHLGDISHKVQEAQNVLGIARANHLQFSELTTKMVNTAPTEEQIEKVMVSLFKTKDDVTTIDKLAPQSQTAIDDILRLAREGRGNVPVAGTAWALYNGITEWSDHSRRVGGHREDEQSRKVFSNWFGSSAEFKNKGLETIREVCGISS